ncbi:CotH kinase family protein [Paenibacillus apiarius]|uniref:CotH kinase family protein n=1 Tax=Paenibacillus apiarius TaxID=46240 RepID=UPI003B3AEE2B
MRFKSALPIILCAGAALLIIITAVTMTFFKDGASGVIDSPSSSDKITEINQNVFPKDEVVDVNITLDEDDFQDMLDNASAEEMKTAAVDYNGMHFDNVGIRTKGNLSLRSVVNSDSDRYSFKLSFDEYLSNQTLYGISKINLNNNYSDASYMREFLTYELAQKMGLRTPGFSFVNVYVNEELRGCYLAVEQVGDAYLERNFGNAHGSLYKAELNGSGTDLSWLGDKADSYSGLVLKSKASSDSALIDMLNELNNGSDYEQVLDVEEVLKYIALNVVTVNWDSYLGSNKQNYYLYENDGVFSVLPWDYNMAFGGGPGGASVLIDEPTQGALSERPLIAKLLAVDEYKDTYHEIIRNAIEGYLSSESFAARVEQVADMISASVEQDPTAFYTFEQHQEAVKQLTETNAGTVGNITQQLDGTVASSGDGSGSGGGFGGPGGGRGGRMPGVDNAGNNDDAAPNNQSAGAPDEQANQGNMEPPGGFGGFQGDAGGANGAGAGQDGAGGANGAGAGQGGAGGANGAGAGQGGAGGANGAGAGQGRPGGAGGFGGGPGGRPPGQGGGGAKQGSMEEAVTTVASLAVLVLACVFVTRYKRKRI